VSLQLLCINLFNSVLFCFMQNIPYKSQGIRGKWTELSMKQAINAAIVHGLSNKKSSEQYGVPLENLRRKVKIARSGGGGEKNLGFFLVCCLTAHQHYLGH